MTKYFDFLQRKKDLKTHKKSNCTKHTYNVLARLTLKLLATRLFPRTMAISTYPPPPPPPPPPAPNPNSQRLLDVGDRKTRIRGSTNSNLATQRDIRAMENQFGFDESVGTSKSQR